MQQPSPEAPLAMDQAPGTRTIQGRKSSSWGPQEVKLAGRSGSSLSVFAFFFCRAFASSGCIPYKGGGAAAAVALCATSTRLNLPGFCLSSPLTHGHVGHVKALQVSEPSRIAHLNMSLNFTERHELARLVPIRVAGLVLMGTSDSNESACEEM